MLWNGGEYRNLKGELELIKYISGLAQKIRGRFFEDRENNDFVVRSCNCHIL